MSTPTREQTIAEAKADGLMEVDGEWVKITGHCDYCQDPVSGGDEHDIHAGDESLTLCDACYDHATT